MSRQDRSSSNSNPSMSSSTTAPPATVQSMPASVIANFCSRSDDRQPQHPPIQNQSSSTTAPPATVQSMPTSLIANKNVNINPFLSIDSSNQIEKDIYVDANSFINSGNSSLPLPLIEPPYSIYEDKEEKNRRQRQNMVSGLNCYVARHGGEIPKRQIDMVMELIDAATEKSILSKIQLRIFIDRLMGLTYDIICKRYHLTDKILGRVLYRTARGKFWNKKMKGGGETLLSDLDAARFVDIVHERENDINCLSTCQAEKIALELLHERAEKAFELLNMCNCPKLAGKVKVVLHMDSKWLDDLTKRHNLNIVPKSDLETMRRIACDKVSIEDFFSKHSHLFERDPRLIFNMDETSVSSNKKFKVIVSKGRIPLSETDPIFPHMSACVTVSAAGHVMKPMLILKNKKSLRGLEDVKDLAYFATSPTGWMNKKLFTYWGLTFLAEIARYRLALPKNLRDKRILLVVDGHRSRANYFIARVFDIYSIDILVFPGHTSHLLQPFDVSIASPLKTAYQKRLARYNLNINGRKGMKEIRLMMIKCILDAINEAASSTNIQSGFRASGLCPLNKEVPLSSKYAMDNTGYRAQFPNLYEKIKNGNLVNNRHLNGNLGNLDFVFKADYKRDLTIDKLVITLENIQRQIQYLYTETEMMGKILTPIPDLIIENNDGIKRINLDANYN